MKHFISLFCCLFVFALQALMAQEAAPQAQLAVISRYQNGKIELRWIAQQASIIQQGFTAGYLISRKEKGKQDSLILAKVLPYSQARFDTLTNAETTPETKALLGMAGEYIYAKGNKSNLNLDNGIGELMDAKNNIEMQSMLLTLAVIKNKQLAIAMGLAYEDHLVEKGKEYEYTIYPLGGSNTYEIIAPKITMGANEVSVNYLTTIESYSDTKRITFVWPASKKVAGYYVERATQANGPFKALNTIPFYGNKGSNISFSDDSVENYVWYHYQFFALNHFGEKVLIGTKLARAIDKTPPSAPILVQPKHVGIKQMEINWSFPETEKDLKGFIVARSHKDTGTFKIVHPQILSASTRNFIDTGFNLNQNNYYVVYALDTAGNFSASTSAYALLIDSVGPTTPNIIKSTMDSFGVVSIQLSPILEKDYMGYQLYRANAPDHEFSLVSFRFEPMENTQKNQAPIVYDTVSLHTLTPKVYYKVKVLDYHYNSSSFSPIYALNRIDTIAPSTPLITDVFVTHNAIKLSFEPSRSLDIKEHILYRRRARESEWTPKIRFMGAPKEYKDTLVKEGEVYQYSLRAMDLSGNFSAFSSPVLAQPYKYGVLPKVNSLQVFQTDSGLYVSWKYTIEKDVTFVVYKNNAMQQMEQYAVCNTSYFLDKALLGSNRYQIKVTRNDGAKSALSEQVEWIIKK